MRELRFEAVTVRYGSGRHAINAVDGVDLAMPPGRIVGLVGESGSGKSTLARAAVGLTPLATGRILLDGNPIRPRGRRRLPLTMIFQDPYSSLDPRMTVGASIAEAIPRETVSGAVARRTEVARLLELVDLDPERAGTLPAEMSGGQRQRVAIARALAGRPEVIIADEITSALDVSIQGTVLNLVRDLQRQLRLSMLFISHNLAVVRYVSDVIAVMYLGQIVERGPASELLSDPQHPYTRELLAAAPRRGSTSLDDDDHAGSAIADVEPPDPHQPPTGCRFHPRCPIGPMALPDREICIRIDPAETAGQRRHQASCHFAAPDPRTAATSTGDGD